MLGYCASPCFLKAADLAFLLFMLPFYQATTTVGPSYPPNALAGGNVVAILHVSHGAVTGVDVLQGDEPFASGTKAALSGWRFEPADSGNIPVVVNFLSSQLYPMGDSSQSVSGKPSSADVAYPKKVVAPTYPPNSIAEGSVVVRLDIDESGGVSKTRIVQGLGGMSDACVAAVRQWQFTPAVNKGNTIPSEAYGICVVRRPALTPKKH